MKLIEEDELHQKFCDKLNNLDGDGGFLNWSYEMVAFADETGLNVDGVISDEEMGLLRHGVSLSYQNLSGAKNTFDIAAAAANGEFVGGDIEDEVYFKYK